MDPEGEAIDLLQLLENEGPQSLLLILKFLLQLRDFPALHKGFECGFESLARSSKALGLGQLEFVDFDLQFTSRARGIDCDLFQPGRLAPRSPLQLLEGVLQFFICFSDAGAKFLNCTVLISEPFLVQYSAALYTIDREVDDLDDIACE